MLATQMSAKMLSDVVHALHIDDTDVDKVVESAVAAACSELDTLFPEVSPESKGISSNFQGLLKEHIRAMLTGEASAHRSTRTFLPKLLATDEVFGEAFELPAEQGAGYLVFNPVTRDVLSVYSGKFVRTARLPDAEFGATPSKAPMYFSFGVRDVDVLFSTHDGATKVALKALNDMGESPSGYPLKIVAAVYDGERDGFVEVA